MRLAGAVLLGAAVSAAAAAPQQPPPLFRGGVELLTLDALVVDKNGQPVRGLRGDDFQVTLDGKDVPVRAVEYVDLARPVTALPGDRGGRASGPLSVTRQDRGRSVLIVIDDLSFSGFEAEPLVSDLIAWLRSLNSTDLVATTTSSRRVSAPFSPQRSDVAAALKAAAVGQRPAPPSSKVRLSMQESKLVQENAPLDYDVYAKVRQFLPSTLNQAFDRECGAEAEEDKRACYRAFKLHAEMIVQETDDALSRRLQAWKDAVDLLRAPAAPRVLLFVSAGLPLDSGVPIRNHVKLVDEAGIQTFFLTPSTSSVTAIEAEDRDAVAARLRRDDDNYLESGLDRLADEAGGRVLRVVASATQMLADVMARTSGFYRIGIDSPASSNAGRAIGVRVRVRRDDAIVRAASVLPTPAPSGAAPSAPLSMDARLGEVVARGRSEAGVPLETAAALQRDESGSQVRALVSTLVPATARGPLRFVIGFANEAGRVVRSASADVSVPTDGAYRGTFPLGVPPGRYRLRVAVATADGQVGATERDVLVRLKPAGPWFASDVMIAWAAGDRSFRSWSIEALPSATSTILATLELYPGTQSGEIIPTGEVTVRGADGRERSRPGVSVRRAGAAWVLLAEITTTGLPPGRYTVHFDTKVAGQAAAFEASFVLATP